jgi:hypothetical protein
LKQTLTGPRNLDKSAKLLASSETTLYVTLETEVGGKPKDLHRNKNTEVADAPTRAGIDVINDAESTEYESESEVREVTGSDGEFETA